MKPVISTNFATSAEKAIATFLKTMGKGKITAIGCFYLLLAEAFFIPVASALDWQIEKYLICRMRQPNLNFKNLNLVEPANS
jgi:hypothetical protein